jgi:hypothetical protein
MKRFLLLIVIVCCCPKGANALSAPKNNHNHNPTSETNPSDQSRLPFLNRRELWKLPLGLVGTYGYGRLVYNALSVRDIKYPETHERRVEETIRRTLLASAPAQSTSRNRPLRVLEVGIGTECRLLRRGLYNPAFQELVNENKGIQKIDLTGVDISLPNDDVVIIQVGNWIVSEPTRPRESAWRFLVVVSRMDFHSQTDTLTRLSVLFCYAVSRTR